MIFLEVFIFILVIFKSLHFTYHFQIKEYRWDRLYSAIKEIGWLPFIYNTKFRFPAKTTRNILILFLVTLITPFISFLSSRTFVIVLIFVPVISFGLTFLAVYLTGFLADFKRTQLIEKAKLKVAASQAICIGVTGTYGKSSVKEFIYQILSKEFKVAKTDKNMNTDIGIALSVFNNLKPQTEYFIAEFGAYKIGEIEAACEIIKPKISVLTGLGNQHIDLYGSRENLIKAETHILTILDSKDEVYINSDFPNSKDAVHNVKAKKTFYSLEKNAIYPLEIQTKGNKQTAKIAYKGELFSVSTTLLGKHNILNLLPAIAIAHDLGMKKEKIIEAINEMKPIPGKLSLHTGIKNSTFINDSYNSVVNGFMAMIDVIESQPAEKKVIVSKGIIELGVEKRPSYKLILDKLAKTDIILFTTDPMFSEVNKKANVITLNDEREILQEVTQIAGKNTVIGLEGKFTKHFIDTILTV